MTETPQIPAPLRNALESLADKASKTAAENFSNPGDVCVQKVPSFSHDTGAKIRFSFREAFDMAPRPIPFIVALGKFMSQNDCDREKAIEIIEAAIKDKEPTSIIPAIYFPISGGSTSMAFARATANLTQQPQKDSTKFLDTRVLRITPAHESEDKDMRCPFMIAPLDSYEIGQAEEGRLHVIETTPLAVMGLSAEETDNLRALYTLLLEDTCYQLAEGTNEDEIGLLEDGTMLIFDRGALRYTDAYKNQPPYVQNDSRNTSDEIIKERLKALNLPAPFYPFHQDGTQKNAGIAIDGPTGPAPA